MFKLLYRYEAIGLHHIPKEGSVILCCNHISNFDPPFLGSPLKRKVHFMAKAELFDIPVVGWLIEQFGAIPVKRGGVSKESIRTGIQLLKENCVMGIFPEGTRNSDSSMAKKGAAMFALRSDAVVIPVAIIGQYKLFRKMRIVYGPPIDLAVFKESKGSETLEAATDNIMAHIRAMVLQHSPK
jgi:1-acyl-sn-glycerol-3-phosphate acyltransferase